jgi:hypothetical protein
MVLFFNIPGILFVLGALVAGMLVSGLVTGEWDDFGALSFFVCGTISLVGDFLFRASRHHDRGPWRFISPFTGGHLVFIPVWVFGLFWLVIGGVEVVTGAKEVRAKNDAFMKETIALLEQTVESLKGSGRPINQEQARELVNRSKDRLQELADFFEGLDESEKSRLDRKYGERLAKAVEQIQLRSARLGLTAD